MSKIIDVLFLIRPNSQFSVGDTFESLKWLDKEQTKPTKAEYDEGVKAYDANQYQRDREADYPSYAEQFDLLYHSGVEGLKAELKKTKDKYPKE